MGFEFKVTKPFTTKAAHLNALIYGVSGAGKTSLATTMPGRVVYFLTEPQARQALEEQLVETGRDPDQIDIIEIEDKFAANGRLERENGRDITSAVYLELCLSRIERDPTVPGTKGEVYGAVILDSLTDLQQRVKDELEDQRGGKGLTRQDWGKVIDWSRRIVKRLRNLKMHVCVLALADEKQDDSQRVYVRPALIGQKLPYDIPQYFNIVGYMSKEKQRGRAERYFVKFQSSSDELATKGHRALDAEEEPNISVWQKKISDYLEGHKASALPTAGEVTIEPEDEPDDGFTPAERKLLERVESNARMKELLELLGTSKELVVGGLKKYRNDDKFIEILEARLVARQEEEGEKAMVAETSP